MTYAIISDIHSNIEALQVVLKDIDQRQVDEIICLGDVIGYGPNPIECADIIKERCSIVLCGNHDEALVQGAEAFNKYAKNAIAWTKSKLRPSLFGGSKARLRKTFLEELPLRYERDGVLFVHASPRDPTCEYLLESDVITRDQSRFEGVFTAFDKFCFNGHTHIPCVITEDLRYYSIQELEYTWTYRGQRAVINVGSVGQPRDRDARASYVTVDGPTVHWHRLDYPKEITREKILRIRQLDDRLGERLLEGK